MARRAYQRAVTREQENAWHNLSFPSEVSPDDRLIADIIWNEADAGDTYYGVVAVSEGLVVFGTAIDQAAEDISFILIAAPFEELDDIDINPLTDRDVTDEDRARWRAEVDAMIAFETADHHDVSPPSEEMGDLMDRISEGLREYKKEREELDGDISNQ